MSAASIATEIVVGFNVFVLFYFIALNSTYLVLFVISLVEVLKFVRRTFFSDYRQIMQSDMTWPPKSRGRFLRQRSVPVAASRHTRSPSVPRL